MAQEPQRLGLRLRDFLDALQVRGRKDEAEEYKRRFVELYCPPFSEEDVLDMPFDALCDATAMINAMKQIPPEESRVSELKSMGYNVTLGEYYLKQKQNEKT